MADKRYTFRGKAVPLFRIGGTPVAEYSDGAVFLLNTEKGFFHAEDGDSASEALDLAGLLAPLYVVLEDFSDGGGVFVEDGEGASSGMAGSGDIQRKIVFVHILVEGLHRLQNFIIIISQAGEVVPASQGVHDVQKAGTGFVENVHISFFIGSVEEGAWVIQSAQQEGDVRRQKIELRFEV